MPEGMRYVKLTDLLPDQVLKKLAPLMNRIGEGRMDPIEGRKALTVLLEPERADLEKKGVLVEYLSYFLLYAAQMGGGGDLHDVQLN